MGGHLHVVAAPQAEGGLSAGRTGVAPGAEETPRGTASWSLLREGGEEQAFVYRSAPVSYRAGGEFQGRVDRAGEPEGYAPRHPRQDAVAFPS